MAKDVASGPKAVNIIRPQHHQRPPLQPPSPSAYSNTSYFSALRKPRVAQAAQIDISRNSQSNYSHSTSTVSSNSTVATNHSSSSASNPRVLPAFHNAANASAASTFTLYSPSMIPFNQLTLGHRQSTIFSPQRSRSNSVHSRSGTVASEPETESESDEMDDTHIQLHEQSQLVISDTESESDIEETDEDMSNSDEEVSKVVAKIKNGTIMNGKGEFVNKFVPEPENEWREEAKVNRKIADLEISNTSLLAINATLETKLRLQAKQIEELKRRLSSHDDGIRTGTPTPDLTRVDDSDEHDGEDDLEGDPSFDKVRVLLEALLADGQKALEHKSKATGRVLTYYDAESDAESSNFSPELPQLYIDTSITTSSQASRRRSSGADSDTRRVSSKPSSPVDGRFPGSMSPTRARAASRSSSPAVLSPSIATSTRSPSPQNLMRHRTSSYRKSLEER